MNISEDSVLNVCVLRLAVQDWRLATPTEFPPCWGNIHTLRYGYHIASRNAIGSAICVSRRRLSRASCDAPPDDLYTEYIRPSVFLYEDTSEKYIYV